MNRDTKEALDSIQARIDASYPVLWVETNELPRATLTILEYLDQKNQEVKTEITALQEKGKEIPKTLTDQIKTLYHWDILHGLIEVKTGECKFPMETDEGQIIPAFQHILAWGNQVEGIEIDQNSAIIVHGFHNLIQGSNNPAKIRSALFQLINPTIQPKNQKELEGLGQGNARCVILVAPPFQNPALSADLDTHIDRVKFPNPSLEEIEEAIEIQMEGEKEPSGKPILEKGQATELAKELQGLSLFQVENAIQLTYIRNRRIELKDLQEQYRKIIEAHPALSLSHFQETWENLVGFERYKTFVEALYHKDRKNITRRGFLLTGVPGGGKSHAAKATGKFLGTKTLACNIGLNMQKGVGDSESNLDNMFQIINSIGRVVLFVDELEKSLGGMGTGGDSGVSSRFLERILIWMNDHPEGPLLIATSNETMKLPPELLRERRWDCIFFVPPPNFAQRRELLNLYGGSVEIEFPEEHVERTKNWTGGEIQALAEKAHTLRKLTKTDTDAIELAYQYVNPMIRSNPEGLQKRLEEGKRWINVNNEKDQDKELAPLMERKGKREI